jgi:mycofactocin system glycosyltransferase
MSERSEGIGKHSASGHSSDEGGRVSELRLRPDAGTVGLADGRVLLGGSPYKVLRLSEKAARLVSGWFDGEPVSGVPSHRGLAARLVRAGIAHPAYESPGLWPRDVTVVVPVRDHAESLARLIPALGELARVVVDDGSRGPVAAATLRHERQRGPAAARNSGWRLATTELVAFVDADVTPEPGWLEPLLAHFEDPEVAAVAPRVRSTAGPSALERYERARSSLDLGDVAAPVRPGSRVSYVPSAALVVRRSALRDLGGFDENLRFGEDVDLVWRLNAAGRQVRYEPSSVVNHAPRARWSAWARQRFQYGTSAAPLAIRHGKAVTPVKVSVWSALSWAVAAAGRPLIGGGVAVTTAALLPRKLSRMGVPAKMSLRLALAGHLGAGRLLADAVTRSWAPVAVPLLATSRRGRLVLAGAYGRHVWDWYRERPPVPLPQWVAARILDDAAYGAGVWWGALRYRTMTPLLPDLADWPGRDGVDTGGLEERPA